MRSQSEVDEYYEDLTGFINIESGLDPLTSDQVKAIWRTHKKMKNKLNGQPTYEPFDPSNDPHKASRCTARRSDGEPCRAFRVPGAVVCRAHGGAAKQIQNSARIRLQNAADRLAKELLSMTTDENISDSVKLAAIKDALDRGGVSAKTELEITARPYEAIFEQIHMERGGSRIAHRRALGIEDTPADQPALPAANREPLEAQIVDDDELADFDDTGPASLNDYGQPITPASAESGSPFDTAPPPEGLMPMDEAVAAQAEVRRQVVQRAREQRALPPGKSGR